MILNENRVSHKEYVKKIDVLFTKYEKVYKLARTNFHDRNTTDRRELTLDIGLQKPRSMQFNPAKVADLLSSNTLDAVTRKLTEFLKQLINEISPSLVVQQENVSFPVHISSYDGIFTGSELLDSLTGNVE